MGKVKIRELNTINKNERNHLKIFERLKEKLTTECTHAKFKILPTIPSMKCFGLKNITHI